jgi:hypothetical protein
MSALRILVPVKRVIDYAVSMRSDGEAARSIPIGHCILRLSIPASLRINPPG